MEDFSHFIHEEIYLIKGTQVPIKGSTQEMHKLAVISGDITEEENILLTNILSALKLDRNDIARFDEVEGLKSERWLIFAESYRIESTVLEFYQPMKIGDATFVLAQPLAVLRDSQQEKQNLWNSLKELFGI